MYWRPLLLIAIGLQLAACNSSSVKQDAEPLISDKKTQLKAATESESDKRGFDPCLLNANLAVCKDNETTNSQ